MSEFDTVSPDFDWSAGAVRWPVTTPVGPGFRGVIAADTRVAWLNGAAGTLHYRGIPIEAVAAGTPFEETAFLLLHGVTRAGDRDRWTDFQSDLGHGRRAPESIRDLIRSLPRETPPIRVLRAGLSALGCAEEAAAGPTGGPRRLMARFVGQVAALAEAVARHRAGREPIPAPAASSIAEALARALDERRASASVVRALDVCLTLYADNGLAPGTFAGMIVGSCLADRSSCVVAALSAFSGTRAGGAAENLLSHFLELPDADTARAWARARIEAGRRLPGFGHRIYRVPDPRVAITKREARALGQEVGDPRLVAIAEAIEDEAAPLLAPRGIHPNFHFYGAVLLHLIGVEPALVPCVIAVARVAGVVARIEEYLEDNRLFRPTGRYVGEAPRPFVPLEAR